MLIDRVNFRSCRNLNWYLKPSPSWSAIQKKERKKIGPFNRVSAKLSRNFEICADSGDEENQVIQESLEKSEERRYEDETVQRERRYTPANEARAGRVRQIQRRRRVETGILQPQLPGQLPQPYRLHQGIER